MTNIVKPLHKRDHQYHLAKSSRRLYRVLSYMKHRCSDKARDHERASYYDKGITVCDEWSCYDTFESWAWLNGHRHDLTIERIDSDKGYSPDNCEWITRSQNSSNVDHSYHCRPVLITDLDTNETVRYNSVTDAAVVIGVKRNTVVMAITRGNTLAKKRYIATYVDSVHIEL